jgi:alkaline phosphatase
MKRKIIKILLAIFFTLSIFSCTKTNKMESDLHESMFGLESEFWFSKSLAHVYLNRMVSEESQIVWSTNFHTAAPVPIGAVGPEKYTNLLKGIIQNDSIGRVMKKAVEDNINVILIIGDGMGNVHMSLPVYARYAQKDNEPTYFEKIMAEGSCGYVYTGTARGLVTGSAASGTAIACGKKTLMNMVGVDSNGLALESVALLAKRKGFNTALVTDASITDATPAAFYAHQYNRDLANEIASELFYANSIDVIMGGGGSNFIPSGTQLSDLYDIDPSLDYQSDRNDSIDLLQKFTQHSYQLCHNKQQMMEALIDQKIIGLFAEGGLPATIDRDSTSSHIPTLPEMANKALDAVSRYGSSYFILIESARIDWEGHDNDAGAVYAAMLEMNQLLKLAYSYYAKSPKNTLLIFTSDHETGGMEIAYRKVPENQSEQKVLENGGIWKNNTNPLLYSDYLKNMTMQKKSVSRIFSMSNSAEELRRNIEQYMGYRITEDEAVLLYYSLRDYTKYKD